MVTISNLEVTVYSLLEKLLDVDTNLEDKVIAFQIISGFVEQNENAFIDILDEQYTCHLNNILAEYALSEESKLSSVSQKLLNLCLQTNSLARKLTEKDSTLLRAACNFALKSNDKTVMVRALAGLSHQNLTPEVLIIELHTILCAVEHAFAASNFTSVVVDLELLSVISRLNSQIPEQMVLHAPRWTKLLCFLLVHNSEKVRAKALEILKITCFLILRAHNEVVKSLVNDIKKVILKKMENLFNSSEEVFVLQAWAVLIDILGKALHCGSSLINSMLEIIEQAFKNQNPEVVKEAFISWQHLIKNFALNPDVLFKGKRLSLLIQPLKLTPAKREDIALIKFKTWWSLIQCLGAKVSHYFEQVCVPLLVTFLGLEESDISTFAKDNSSPPNNIKTSQWDLNKSNIGIQKLNLNNVSSKTCQSPTVILLGCEALLSFLSLKEKNGCQAFKYNLIEPLLIQVVTGPTFFANFAPVFFASIRSIFLSIKPDDDDRLLYLWQQLINHVTAVVENGNKDLSVKVINLLLASLEYLLHNGNSNSLLGLKLLESVTLLPPRILNSSAYELRKIDNMGSTPILTLLELLFHSSLLNLCGTEEKFMEIFNNLISSNQLLSTDRLSFCKSVFSILNQVVDNISDKETLWKLWNSIVGNLKDFITKNSDVNEGDALEHDFSCLYAALLFPVKYLFEHLLSSPIQKKLIKTWDSLYNEFSRCADMVSTTLPNACCEDLSAKLIDLITPEKLQNIVFLENIVQVASVILHAVDFSDSSFSLMNNTLAVTLSPSRWTKKKQKPLNNLTSFVKLVQNLLMVSVDASSSSKFDNLDKVLCSSIIHSVHKMLIILNTLFTHVNHSSMMGTLLSCLSTYIAKLYEESSKKTTSKLYTPGFIQKLQKLWSDITSGIQNKYNGPFDSNFLNDISPLLEVTFLHPKRPIRNQTVVLWHGTFAHCTSLKYPESLKPILLKAKEKTSLSLPAFDFHHFDIIEETPLSNIADSELPNDSPFENVSKSPLKLYGSFLSRLEDINPSTKDVSPSKLKIASPAKVKIPSCSTCKSPVKSKNFSPLSKKLKPIDEASSQEFVVISSSPVKKRVLTNHQKEVFQNKKIEAVLFNMMDNSQINSTSSEFCTNTQMDDCDSQISQTVVNFQINFSDQTTITSPTTSKKKANFEDDLRNTIANNAHDKAVKISVAPVEEIISNNNFTNIKDFFSDTICFELSIKKSIDQELPLHEVSHSNNSKTVTIETSSSLSPKREKQRRRSNSPLKKSSFSPCSPNGEKQRRRSCSPQKKSPMQNTNLIKWLQKSPSNNNIQNHSSKTNEVQISDSNFTNLSLSNDDKNLVDNNNTKVLESAPESILCIENVDLKALLVKPEINNCNGKTVCSDHIHSELENEKLYNKSPAGNKKKKSNLCLKENKSKRHKKPAAKSRRSQTQLLYESASTNFPGICILETQRNLRKFSKTNSLDDANLSSRKSNKVSSKLDKILQYSANRKSKRINKGNADMSTTEFSAIKNEFNNISLKSCSEKNSEMKDDDDDDDDNELFKALKLKRDPSSKVKKDLAQPTDGTKPISDLVTNTAMLVENCHLDNDSDSTDDEVIFSFRPPMFESNSCGNENEILNKFERNEVETSSQGFELTKNCVQEKMESKNLSLDRVLILEKDSVNEELTLTEDSRQETIVIKNEVRNSQQSSHLLTSSTDSLVSQSALIKEKLSNSENINFTISSDIPKTVNKSVIDGSSQNITEQKFEPLDTLMDMYQEPEIIPKKKSEQFSEYESSEKSDIINNHNHLTINVDSLYCEEQVYESPLNENSDGRHCESHWIAKSTTVTDVNKNSESVQNNYDKSNFVSNEFLGSNIEDKKTDEEMSPILHSVNFLNASSESNNENMNVEENFCQNNITEDNKLEKKLSDANEEIDTFEIAGQIKNKELKISDTKVTNDKYNCLDISADSRNISNHKGEPNNNVTSCVISDAISDIVSVDQENVINTEDTCSKLDKIISNGDDEIKVNSFNLEKSPKSMKFTFAHPCHSSPHILSKKKICGGILKNAHDILDSSMDLSTKENPNVPETRFSPIILDYIYSPAASPSAGILKKRKFNNDLCNNSPSPPDKRRRVSFANPLVQCEMEIEANNKKTLTVSRPVNRCLYSVKNYPLSWPVTSAPAKTNTTSPKFSTIPVNISTCESNSFQNQSLQLTSSYQDSPSQLNSQDPIFPELIGNTSSVDDILPQLTSSIWARGLNQVIKARNIHTIGDFSSLTEYDVNNLPVRSPKIQIVKQVLEKFYLQTKKKKSKMVKSLSEKGKDDTSHSNNSSPDHLQPLPAVEDMLETMFTDKKDDALDVTLEEMPESCNMKDSEKYSEEINHHHEKHLETVAESLNNSKEIEKYNIFGSAKEHDQNPKQEENLGNCESLEKNSEESHSMQTHSDCSLYLKCDKASQNIETNDSLTKSFVGAITNYDSNNETNKEHETFLNCVERLNEQFSAETLSLLRKDQIDQIFQMLSNMTTICFQAMKDKCSSLACQRDNTSI